MATQQDDSMVQAAGHTNPHAIDRQHRSSYSLLLLFYLTTMAAIVAAACRLAVSARGWSISAFLWGYLVAGVLAVVAGMVIGFLVGRHWQSMLLGLATGLLCGLVAVLLTLVEPVHFVGINGLVWAGCWLMAMIAIGANRLGSHSGRLKS